MAPRAYDALSQEEPDVIERPTTYYGEGAFNPPDSDDEEEELIEKPRTPGAAEAARQGFESGDLGLYVGGPSQAVRSLRPRPYASSPN